MFSGKRFILRVSTIAIDTAGGVAKQVPSGSIIQVISGSTPGDPLVKVLYEGRRMVMFAIDIKQRGQEMDDRSPEA